MKERNGSGWDWIGLGLALVPTRSFLISGLLLFDWVRQSLAYPIARALLGVAIASSLGGLTIAVRRLKHDGLTLVRAVILLVSIAFLLWSVP